MSVEGTIDYRSGGQYVLTVGDTHTLYGRDKDNPDTNVPIYQWTGADESHHSTYAVEPGGKFSWTDPDTGRVTLYETVGGKDRPVSVSKDGVVVGTYDYANRPDGQSVYTEDGVHTLLGADGKPIKFWKGDDESQASTYGPGAADVPGSYTITSPDQSVTLYGPDGTPITTWLNDGSHTVIDWKVDLAALGYAIETVSGIRDDLYENLGILKRMFDSASGHWRTPAAVSFYRLRDDFDSASQHLNGFMAEAVERMKKAKANYVDGETASSDGMQRLRDVV